jgi:hypothetical protein
MTEAQTTWPQIHGKAGAVFTDACIEATGTGPARIDATEKGDREGLNGRDESGCTGFSCAVFS